MRQIEVTNQYKKDFALAKKRNLPIAKLNDVITKLANDEMLPETNRDHCLSGINPPVRECHILPDWLLIYNNGTASCK